MNLWVKSLSVIIQRKATEQYSTVVLFYYVVQTILTLESVGEILKCDY